MCRIGINAAEASFREKSASTPLQVSDVVGSDIYDQGCELYQGAAPDTFMRTRPAAHELQSAEYDQLDRCGNDPSAGSPTETLLRLHLPLNDEV